MSAPMGPHAVAMVLIARDEAENIGPCFDSFWPHVDEVVLVDTGSKDDTVAIAEAYAEERGEPDKLTVGHFEWCEDFSAARNYAETLATAPWRSWCDLDDRIRGAENLRGLAAQAPPDLNAYVMGYDYAQDPAGNCICQLRRERLVRAGTTRWENPVHEAQSITQAMWVGPEICEWVHHKTLDALKRNDRRNLRLLRAWAKRDSENPRVLAYLGTEYGARGNHKTALSWFRKYLRIAQPGDPEHVQVHRKLASTYVALGRLDDAEETAWRGVRLDPAWPDSYLTLAEIAYTREDWTRAGEFAADVLRRGVPDTMLIINPQDYTVQPRVMIAGCAAQLGEIDRACEMAEALLAEVPGHPLREAYTTWLAERKRRHTVALFTQAAQILTDHDEQERALAVIESVPHYIQDDAAVVTQRSALRERIYPLYDPESYAEHYRTGGSKPEDMVPDENVLPLGDQLPRCAFLLEGLTEQRAAA